MIGSSLAHYEIIAKLGAGGMGEVYRARDTKLGREVAIKVLPEKFAADPARLARFEREAQTLASLDHPGIASIHDLQEADETRFLVMQLVEGPTLAERLRSGPLDRDTALPLFQQIAEALDYAHARGVVHRDLKPSNIKVTEEGKAKVLDFGLAKALDDPGDTGQDPAEAPTIDADEVLRTSQGQIIGTPAYMSPEQARGETVDKRADVWAFGCCLYEALTGRRPFTGKTPSDLIAEILKTDPDWSRIPEDTPAPVVVLLRRSLEKDSRRRLSSMGDLAITFEETTSGLRQSRSDLRGPARSADRRGRIAVAGVALVALAAVIGWRFLGGRDTPAGNAGPSGGTAIERIAVLPFSDDSGEAGQEWFIDGMTGVLIAELARIDALSVISRTSAMQFKNPDRPIREIASRLGADALVEGSVTRVGDDVRIIASLIDGSTERTMWTEQYHGTIDDALNLQSRIATAIAREIDVVLTPEEIEELGRDRNVDPRALDAYLRGVHELTTFADSTFERAISFFEEARRIQPDFALAHAQVADALVDRFIWGFSTREEVYDPAAAAEKAALDHDPDLALALSARARRFQKLDWDWEQAEPYHKRAIESDPDSADVLHAFAMGLVAATHRYDEAIELGRRAVELEPTVPIYHVDLAEMMIYAGRFDDAAEVLDQVYEKDPEFSVLYLLRGYLRTLTGQYEEAIRDSAKLLELSGNRRHMEYLATALALGGRSEQAREALREFEELAKTEFIQQAEFGMVYLALGDHDKAYELFERSFERRENKLTFLTGTRFFESVETKPRLKELVNRVKRFD